VGGVCCGLGAEQLLIKPHRTADGLPCNVIIKIERDRTMAKRRRTSQLNGGAALATGGFHRAACSDGNYLPLNATCGCRLARNGF
jgi:hypothetical protein